MTWVRFLLFTNLNLQKVLQENIKLIIDRLRSDGYVKSFYFFQYPQEGKISFTIEGNVEQIRNALNELLTFITYDSEKTKIIAPFDAENDL